MNVFCIIITFLSGHLFTKYFVLCDIEVIVKKNPNSIDEVPEVFYESKLPVIPTYFIVVCVIQRVEYIPGIYPIHYKEFT